MTVLTALSYPSRVRFARTLKRQPFWQLSRYAFSAAPLFLGSVGRWPMQTGTDPFGSLTTQTNTIFQDLITIAKNIAPAVGILGFIGLGILYMGSSWPIISNWKQQNPQAAGNVMLGLFFVLFASL